MSCALKKLKQNKTKSKRRGFCESKGDDIRINDQKMQPESYRGTSSGSRYILKLAKSDVFRLVISHGGSEITKQVKTQHFSVEMPTRIVKSESLKIPYSNLNGGLGTVMIEVSSLNGKDPILLTDKYQRAQTLNFSETSLHFLIESLQLKNLKTGRAALRISKIHRQDDGTYANRHRREIEISD